VSIDFLRGYALLLIVMVHVTASGFYKFSASWMPVVVYGSIARMGVPLFFMVSGALLLHREVTPRSIFRRVWKLVIPLVFWSVCYLIWLQGRSSMSYEWLLQILRGPVAIHLWFLYTMIGAYLFLPMLGAFHMHASKANQILVLAAWFVGASVLSTVSGMSGKGLLGVDLSFMPLYAGYIFLGAFLARQPLPNRRVAFGISLLVAVTARTVS
jgi:surface polysaccharide O-acyltransferase-like enzyme